MSNWFWYLYGWNQPHSAFLLWFVSLSLVATVFTVVYHNTSTYSCGYIYSQLLLLVRKTTEWACKNLQKSNFCMPTHVTRQ